MPEPKIAVVVPTNRPERIAAWWEAWREQLAGCETIVVHDAPSSDLMLAPDPDHAASGRILGATIRGPRVVSWADIYADLGADAWIIPRRSDCVRSYGFLIAHRAGADIIMTMDDDCLPATQEHLNRAHGLITERFPERGYPKEEARDYATRWVSAHSEALVSVDEEAWETTIQPWDPRGYPIFETRRKRTTVISHGLWRCALDLDAVTTLARHRRPFANIPYELRSSGEGDMPKYVVGTMGGAVHTVLEEKVIPPGRYFPMCGMNLAFTREIAPAMYFLLMGHVVRPVIHPQENGPSKTTLDPQPLPFDRWGDIGCGLYAKKIADHLGLAVRSGSPHVLHERASDPFVNLRKEAAAIHANETWWRRIDDVRLRGSTVAECYGELAEATVSWDGEWAEYWKLLGKAMQTWLRVLEA